MNFVWFWTFWHWSKESFRSGALLRHPVQGVSGHWDEWFRHEATARDIQAIEEVGRSESYQRQFINWLLRYWAHESEWRGNQMIPRYILGQLAKVQPFARWSAFEDYRASYGRRGVSAIVLYAESSGEAEDVRHVEALLLPAPAETKTATEGFKAGTRELDPPRSAALSLLCGKEFLHFLTLWIAGGHRPYSRRVKCAIGLGWITVGTLIVYLLFGPEPGKKLIWYCTALTTLWISLIAVGIVGAARQGFAAWHQGRRWGERLERSLVLVRMNGGLTIKGGSAGLPFCLNILLSLSQSENRQSQRSWIWERFGRRMQTSANIWAATGVITAEGAVKPVVLEPKLMACLQQGVIKHLITPKQSEANRRVISETIKPTALSVRQVLPKSSSATWPRLGFAAEKSELIRHQCRSVAHALMILGDFSSNWQKMLNVFALGVSCVMIWTLPDLRAAILPPSAPVAVPPSSSSPYYLWVNLDTEHPGRFKVVMESGYWANRRAYLSLYGGDNASKRAEIFLYRVAAASTPNEEDGSVWIERRSRFMNREYARGERVGHYSVSYLTHLPHE